MDQHLFEYNGDLSYPKAYVQLDESLVFYCVIEDTDECLKLERYSFNLLTKQTTKDPISITNRSSTKKVRGIVFADDLKVDDSKHMHNNSN